MENFVTLIFYTSIMVVVLISFSQAALCELKGKYRKYYIWFVISVLILSFTACFRGETGSDSKMYADFYSAQIFERKYNDFEIGYVALCKILYNFGMPYQVLFFVISFVQSFLILKCIVHEQEYIDVKLATFIYISYFYLNSFNGMRQLFAVSICIYAILMYLDKKRIRSIVLILLANLFHRTAFISLAIIIAKYVFDKKSKSLTKIMTISAFVMLTYFVFNRQILNEIYRLFSGKYTGYLSNEVASDGNWIMYLIKFSPIFIFSIISYNNYKINSKYLIIFGLTISGLIFGMLEYLTNTQVGRIGYYFSYLDIFLIGYIAQHRISIKRIHISTQKIKIIMYTYFYVVFIYNYAYKNFSELFPYKGLF